MSYSRWMDSRWYSYWAYDEDSVGRDGQVFDVCLVGRFTYKDLKRNRKQCLNLIAHKDKSSIAELEELSRYMDAFCKDVELEYSDE